MGTKIAVDGCELEILPPASGNYTITSVADTEVLVGGANGKGVYFKEISFSLSGCTAGDITHSDGAGSGKITATGSNVLKGGSNGDKVLLEGDTSDEITVNGTKGVIFPQSASGTLKVRVKSAGQSDVEVS